MSPRRFALALATCFGSAAVFACGDDAGGDGATDDGGANPGAGASGEVDESALASDLTAAEVEDACAALDDAAGLLGDVERACQVEAWLATFDQAECESILAQCNEAGATMFQLELPSTCAQQGAELTDCDVTVAEMLACAEAYGEFWASRTCAMEGLFEEGPICDEELAMRCPSLYGSSTGGSSSGGSSTGGSCGGLAPSCVLQSSSSLCSLVDGCLWLSSSETCSGVAQACASYNNQASCSGQNGCSWTP